MHSLPASSRTAPGPGGIVLNGSRSGSSILITRAPRSVGSAAPDGAALYFASNASSFTNGAVLRVDGGT